MMREVRSRKRPALAITATSLAQLRAPSSRRENRHAARLMQPGQDYGRLCGFTLFQRAVSQKR
jgi:hypothetical protein